MGDIRQSASPQAARFLDVTPTSGLKSCVHDFLCLHCLVFKEHCLPASSLSVLCASQLLYNTSFSSFCQELFEIFLSLFSKQARLAFRPKALLLYLSDNNAYITLSLPLCQHFFEKILKITVKGSKTSLHFDLTVPASPAPPASKYCF